MRSFFSLNRVWGKQGLASLSHCMEDEPRPRDVDWPNVLRWRCVPVGPEGCCPREEAVHPPGGTGRREASGSAQLLAGLIRVLVLTLEGEKQPLPPLQCRGACHPYSACVSGPLSGVPSV